MKKIFLSLLIIAPAALLAQVKIDRTQAPKPGPAPVIKVGEPASFTLANGLKVFVVQNTKLPRVSATLTIDREAIQEGDKAGMISMAGELFRRGTTKMNKAVLDEEIDYLGANINASARSVSGGSLKNNFPKVFGLMADIALRPSFPADELEKIRRQELSGLAQNKEDANAIAGNVVSKLVYGKNHPYGEVETEETAKKVTVDDIKKYYGSYWKPNIAYLIFVGDITVEEAKKLTETNFGAWEKGTVPAQAYPVPAPPAKTYIAIVDRPSSVQSVINLVTPIDFKPGGPDAISGSVMNNLLGNGASGRLYKNLREKYGFTYGAYSQLQSDRVVGNFTASASVRNDKTDSAIGQFLVELNRIRNEAVSADEVSMSKNEMSGSFARSLESPATIANFALNVARYNLPKDYYQNYLKNLSAVDVNAVKTVADKYVLPTNMHIVIVGNAKQIAKGLEKYGEVKYFDVYGNEQAAPSEKKADASVTPEAILKKSIEAQGGEAAINAVKDVIMKGTASVMGQNLDFAVQYVIPGGYVQELSAGGNSFVKQMVKNGVYSSKQQGMEQPLKDDDKEELDETAALFLETYMTKKGGYTFTVKGIEQVEGKDAYNIEIKSPKARAMNFFYDLASGMRVKENRTQESPGGNVTVSITTTEYKTFNGVKLPVKQILDAGQFKLNFDIKEVKVNQGLKADDLK
ncbi:MAG: pitrilysin family protein [Bacteroidota bacterium]